MPLSLLLTYSRIEELRITLQPIQQGPIIFVTLYIRILEYVTVRDNPLLQNCLLSHAQHELLTRLTYPFKK